MKPVSPSRAANDRAFEKAKVCFEQNFEQFRHLNEQMNKIPAFAVTLTGGFWYIAVVVNYGSGLSGPLLSWARFCLMIFAAIADVMLVFIAFRIRDVMAGYQEKLKEFEGKWWPNDNSHSFFWYRDYSMISMYGTMLLAGAILSLAGAFILFWGKTGSPLWVGIGAALLAFVLITSLAYMAPKWLKKQA